MRKALNWLLLSSMALSFELGAVHAPAADTSAEARLHYDRAVELYSRGSYAAALDEMRLVRELSHSYKILYNMGQVRAAMNDHVGAIEAYEQYVAEAGGELSEQRRADVDRAIAALKSRVATLTVRAARDATVLIDGSSAGQAPLELAINAGVHRIRVQSSQQGAQEKTVTLAEGSRLALDFGPAVHDTLVEQAPEHERPRYLAWSVAGGLAVASVPFGIAAWNAQHDNATRARVFAGVCDALWLSAAGLGVWLVLDPGALRNKRNGARREPVVLQIGADGAALRGSF